MVYFRVRARECRRGQSYYLIARNSHYKRNRRLRHLKKRKPKSYFNQFVSKKEEYLGKVILNESPFEMEYSFKEWTEKVLGLPEQRVWEQFPYPAQIIIVAQYVAFYSKNHRLLKFCQK